MKILQYSLIFATTIAASSLLIACGDKNSNSNKDISIRGSIQDGPVTGGTIYVFTDSTITNAIDASNEADDRAAALAASKPVAQIKRSESDEAVFSLKLGKEFTNEALFFIFDSEGAVDEVFRDKPFNLEAVAVIGAAGSSQIVNLSPHTTLASIQLRNELRSGGTIGASQIDTAIDSVIKALGIDDSGKNLFEVILDPTSTTDTEALEAASTFVGELVRRAATITDTSLNDVVALLAGDSADGFVDGAAPAYFELDAKKTALVAEIANIRALTARPSGVSSAASCSANAASLKQACGYKLLDEYFVATAVCADTISQAEADNCKEELALEYEETVEQCNDIYDARIKVCEKFTDAIYEPAFGPDYASSFVNPLEIGVTVDPNPYFPLVQGNRWIYQGEFEEDGENTIETVEVVVTNKTKLINGIHCLVVQDIVHKNGKLAEDTDDWYAQDLDGNLWYCGEEVKDYEYFEGDEPQAPELVAINGSFKSGVEKAKPGISLPGPGHFEVGDLIRQEVDWANAEDIIEILEIDNNNQTVAGFTCANNCLRTRDFSAMDPGVEEEKFYVPGVGKILEYHSDNPDARLELLEFIHL